MCQICDDWESGQLSSKAAFQQLGQAIKLAKTPDQRNHFMAACGKIVEKEVPEPKVDEVEDRRFWEDTHRGGDDE